MGSSLHLAHVSDLHIQQSGGLIRFVQRKLIKGLAAASDESLRALARSAGRPALTRDGTATTLHCVASGDLTALGGRDEITFAMKYLETSLARLRAGLEYGPHGGYSHVLGNHDVWGGGLLRGTLRGTSAKRKVEDLLAPLNAPRTLIDRHYHAEVGGLRVRIYLLDSTAEGFNNIFAGGRVSLYQLNRLAETVRQDEQDDRDEGAKGCLRIAVLHHPLVVKRPWYGGFVLENATEVATYLRNLSFGLALCGHDHEQNIDPLQHGLLQCIAGSGSQANRDTNTFLVCEIVDGIDRDSRVSIQISRYKRDASVSGSGFRLDPVAPLHAVTVAQF